MSSRLDRCRAEANGLVLIDDFSSDRPTTLRLRDPGLVDIFCSLFVEDTPEGRSLRPWEISSTRRQTVAGIFLQESSSTKTDRFESGFRDLMFVAPAIEKMSQAVEALARRPNLISGTTIKYAVSISTSLEVHAKPEAVQARGYELARAIYQLTASDAEMVMVEDQLFPASEYFYGLYYNPSRLPAPIARLVERLRVNYLRSVGFLRQFKTLELGGFGLDKSMSFAFDKAIAILRPVHGDAERTGFIDARNMGDWAQIEIPRSEGGSGFVCFTGNMSVRLPDGALMSFAQLRNLVEHEQPLPLIASFDTAHRTTVYQQPIALRIHPDITTPILELPLRAAPIDLSWESVQQYVGDLVMLSWLLPLQPAPVLQVTPVHRLLVLRGAQEMWVPAGVLDHGDRLVGGVGVYYPINDNVHPDWDNAGNAGAVTVFDLVMPNIHNYFVCADATHCVVAHNK